MDESIKLNITLADERTHEVAGKRTTIVKAKYSLTKYIQNVLYVHGLLKFYYVWKHVRHLKSPNETWEELKKVCSTYKPRKLNDEFWYIITWEEVKDLIHRVHEVIDGSY